MTALRQLLSVCCVFAVWVAPSAGLAHQGGEPSIARPLDPSGVGDVADESVEIMWWDSAASHATIPALIDWYYTPTLPPTFHEDDWPASLQGEPIAIGVLQEDPVNTLRWDTSEVPWGTYWVWSVTYDPPYSKIAVSRGAVTVAHAGDPVSPAVLVSSPDSPNDLADAIFVIRYEAFDPTGTATVSLDATLDPEGADLTRVVEDLPATLDGHYVWDTSALAPGEWLVKATIIDDRGLSASAWAASFVTVEHLPVTEPPRHAQSCSAGAGAAGSPGGAGWLLLCLGLLTLRPWRVRRRVWVVALTALGLVACAETDHGLETVTFGLDAPSAPFEEARLVHDDIENGRLDAFFPSYTRCLTLGSCGSYTFGEEPGATNTVARLRGNIDVTLHPHAYGRAATWEDYELSLRFKPDVNHMTAAATFGVHRYGGSGYWLEYSDGEWSLRKAAFPAGVHTQLHQVDFPVKPAAGDHGGWIAYEDWHMRWHDLTIRLTRIGAGHELLIELFVDGQLILYWDDSTPVEMGGVDLRWTGPDTAELLIDDVRVTSLTDSRYTWTQTGRLNGGWFTTVAAHPDNPAIAYAGAYDGGLFRTTDAGVSWTEIGVPHGLDKVRLRTIVLAPSDPNVIYVGAAWKHDNPLWRSDDGGNTWRWGQAGDVRMRKNLDLPGYSAAEVRAIAVDPADAMHIFTSFDNDGVYESFNGGETFELQTACRSSALPSFDQLSPFGRSPACTYKAARASGGGWMTAIAVDPTDPSTVFAGNAGGGAQNIRRLDSANGTWTAFDVPGAKGEVYQFLFAESGDQRAVFAIVGTSVYRSLPQSDGWSAWAPVTHACGSAGKSAMLSNVSAMRLVPHTDQIVAFRGADGCSAARVVVSSDLGASWSPIPQQASGPHSYFVERGVDLAGVPGDPPVIYAVAGHIGIAVSDDMTIPTATSSGSMSWSARDEGLEGHRILALATPPHNPDVVFTGDRIGLYRSSDRGVHWEAVRATDSYLQEVLAIAIDNSNPDAEDVVYIAGVGGWAQDWVEGKAVSAVTPIRRSAAGGAKGTFKDARGNPSVPFPFDGVTALVLDPNNPQILYAGTGKGPYRGWHGWGLWRSKDGGQSWDERLADPNEPHCGDAIGDVEVAAVVVDADSPGQDEEGRPLSRHLAVATMNARGVYVSHDGGECFEALAPLDLGLEDPAYQLKNDGFGNKGSAAPNARSMIYALAMDPSDPEVLYAGTNVLNGVAGPAFTPTVKHNGEAIFKYSGGQWDLIYRAHDNGALIRNGAPNQRYGFLGAVGVDAIVIDPVNPANVYFALHDPGVLMSPNGGDDFRWVNEGLVPTLAHMYPLRMAIAADADGDAVLYAGSCGRGVFRNQLYTPE